MLGGTVETRLELYKVKMLCMEGLVLDVGLIRLSSSFDHLDIVFSNFKVYILNVETLNDRSKKFEETLKDILLDIYCRKENNVQES